MTTVRTTPAVVTSTATLSTPATTTSASATPSSAAKLTPSSVANTSLTRKPVAGTNSRTLFQALSTRIHELQAHYLALSKLNKWYTCYSGRCLPTKVSDCYSPLCRARCRLRSELLELLHKANALNQANKENKQTTSVTTPQQLQKTKIVETESEYLNYYSTF